MSIPTMLINLIYKDSSCILPLVKGIDVIHEVRCLESFGRTSVTAGPDGSVRIWDILTGECKMVLIGHAASGNYTSFLYPSYTTLEHSF